MNGACLGINKKITNDAFVVQRFSGFVPAGSTIVSQYGRTFLPKIKVVDVSQCYNHKYSKGLERVFVHVHVCVNILPHATNWEIT